MKIWESENFHPIMSFDLGQAMVDVIWSPFRASVFIALSLNKVYAYDLENDRHTRTAEIKPINCDLTNLALNNRDPIMLTGDVKGNVVVIKLAQSLASSKTHLIPGVDNPDDAEFMQSQKELMDRILLLGNIYYDDEEEEGSA